MPSRQERNNANQDRRDPTRPEPPYETKNPCGPWDVPGVDPTAHHQPCDCDAPRPKPSTPCRKPPRTRGKDRDCCQQLLEILQRMPGGRDIRLRKPKQPVKVKVANLCCKLPIKDSVIPMLLLFLRRWLDKTPPKNDFEKGIQAFLAGLPAKQIDGLKIGLDAYEKMPASVRECVFETRFDGCDDDDLLDPKFLFKVWLNEAIHIGRATLFDKHDGTLGPGKVRPWEWKYPLAPDSTTAKVETAPWPWICAVNPGGDARNWYKNTEVAYPGNIALHEFRFEDYEFAKICTPVPDSSNPSGIKFNCDYERPPVPPPPSAGSFPSFAQACHNNDRYNYPDSSGTVCLNVPKTYPGQGMAVRGLNFCSPNCKALLRRIGGGFQDLLLDCGVIGDDVTPDKRNGKVVASCEVRDVITFTIPEKVRVGLNDLPVPPGRYTLEIIVPNDSNYAPAPGPAPKEFISRNNVWLDMLPSPTQEYRFWTDDAFCVEETDGLGSDEPWFQAYTVRFVPSGTSAETMFPQQSLTICREEDIDSGDSISVSSPDFFKGKFSIGEVFAMSAYGLEVDSEDAAKEQIDNFGDAYGQYWEKFFLGFIGSDIGVVGLLLKAGVTTGVGLALGAAGLFVFAIGGLFYAAWAPADPIGYDFITFDAVSLFDVTNPATPLPASLTKQFDEDLSLVVNGLEKKVQPGGTQAKYSEEHIYRNDDEDSTYRIVYHAERI
jgi:hypothetical protein